MRKNPTDKIIERLEPDPTKEDVADYCTADLEWYGTSNLVVNKSHAIKWIGRLIDDWREQHRQAMSGPMTAAQMDKLKRTVGHLAALEAYKRDVEKSTDRKFELPSRWFAETNFRVNPATVVPARPRVRKLE